jgi:hypothetical protein
MPRPKETDRAPDGYITPQTAAEILGYTPQTIRNQIKGGRLEGTEFIQENGEPRYYVSRAALSRIMALRSEDESDNGSNLSEYGLMLVDAVVRHAGELVRLHHEAVEDRAAYHKEMRLYLDKAQQDQAIIKELQGQLLDAFAEGTGHLRTTALSLEKLVARDDRRARDAKWTKYAIIVTGIVLAALMVVLIGLELYLP